jgi:hypothetical protein
VGPARHRRRAAGARHQARSQEAQEGLNRVRLRERRPAQRHRLVGVERLHHRIGGPAEPLVVTGVEHVIAEFAVVGQPGPSAQDREFATHRGQAQRGAGLDAERDRVVLRIHHQSPAGWCHNHRRSQGRDPMMLEHGIDAISS